MHTTNRMLIILNARLSFSLHLEVHEPGPGVGGEDGLDPGVSGRSSVGGEVELSDHPCLRGRVTHAQKEGDQAIAGDIGELGDLVTGAGAGVLLAVIAEEGASM